MSKIEKIDVKRVQETLLTMAKKVAQILEEHNIPHMIAYGTLLGAVRHQNFIPWDDDFDFYLFDDTYDEAMYYLREALPANMFLEDEKSEPLYFHGWAHVKDLNSETFCKQFPQDSLYAHKGISVDLYRTKRMPERELEKYLNAENRAYIERRKKNNLIDDAEYKNRIQKLYENENAQFSESMNQVYNLVPLYKCHCMKAEYVFPLKKYVFGDTEFYGPNNADGILRDIYGDYMKLPPIEKRTWHYSSVKFLKQ